MTARESLDNLLKDVQAYLEARAPGGTTSPLLDRVKKAAASLPAAARQEPPYTRPLTDEERLAFQMGVRRGMRDGAETLALIDALRHDEGHSVTLVNDNADFNGLPNCAIEVVGDWTGWEWRRFTGETVLEALRNAKAAMSPPLPAAQTGGEQR